MIITLTGVGKYLINLGSSVDIKPGDKEKIRWFTILITLSGSFLVVIFMYIVNILNKYILFAMNLFSLLLGQILGAIIYLSLNLDISPEEDPEEELIEYLKKYKEEEKE